MREEFFTPGNIPLKVLRRNPQPPYPLHSHDFMEMVIVISGEGVHYDPQGTLPIERGAVFVIKGEMIHGYKELRNLHLINILFDMDHLAIPRADIGRSPGYHSIFTVDPTTRFTDIKRLIFRLDDENLCRLSGEVDHLEMILSRNDPGDQFLAISKFMQIVYFVSREYDKQFAVNRPALPYRLGQVFSYIETHLAKNITIDELKALAGMSESTLFRSFKKITGFSPLQYHQHLRVERACWYLKNSPFTMLEISDLLGYNDSNYFTRQFGKVKGVSPSSYRKS